MREHHTMMERLGASVLGVAVALAFALPVVLFLHHAFAGLAR